MNRKSDHVSGKKKKTIEDWNRLTSEEKKQLPPEELEALCQVFGEWFARESPQVNQKFDADLQVFLFRLSNLDSFLIDRQDDLDILFLTQGKYFEKRDFVEHVKQELRYYASYFNDELSDEELDGMWDKISEIEIRYKRILSG
ncbi:MAG: hypothetical protein KKA76_10600 [Proteobacteria bacterium]|nr:hypothetical protein [Pseudomonadota bacterium]